MSKTLKYETRKDVSKSKKNLNTIENYLLKNLSTNIWRNKNSSLNDFKDDYKMAFLKGNDKATKVLPKKMKKSRNAPNNLGYFESEFGTVSVGYKKYKKNTDVIFTLIPEKVRKEEKIPIKNPNSPNTYFGAEKKKFKTSKISFKYDKDTEKIEKLENDHDGIVDKESNLLYEDDQENKEIENLENSKFGKSHLKKYEINRKIDDLEEIKKEKRKDNLQLLKEIRNFIKKIQQGTLRKIIDSDEVITRSQRMSDFPSDILILRKMLENFINENSCILEKFKNLDINSFSEEELKQLLREIKNKID